MERMIWNWLGIVGIVFLLNLPGIAAEEDLRVSNRIPLENEVGYRPLNEETLTVSPPGFVWLPEPGADSYTLQCSQNSDFSTIGYEKQSITGNVHCPPVVLESGTWYWRYSFSTKEGKPARWSQTRTFTIAPDAVAFPEPTLDQLLDRIPQEHPKLYLRPQSIAPFRESIQRNHPQMWAQFLANGAKWIKDPDVKEEPAPYPQGHRGDSKENIDLWRKNRGIVQKAVDHAANLAFLYRLTGETRFGERAREWILAVVAWPANGTTSYAYNDECAMPILSVIPRAYTWAYDVLGPDDREAVIQTMTARGNEVYRYLLERRHTVSPFESHRNRAWHFLNETSIAFIEDIPDAKTWLQYTLDIFFNVYPVWSDAEGGWHEGVAYWSSYIDRIAWWLDTIKTSLGIDGYKKPFFSHSGDFPLYVFPPQQEFGGFGDSADTASQADLGPVMSLLADRMGNPYWKWYATQVSTTDPTTQPTYLDLLRLHASSLEPVPPTDLPDSKVFRGTGIASLHSNLGNPSEDVHFLFKSSPFGRQSHGYNAQNSFLLWGYGQPLLIGSGHRDWHGSPHHTEWMWETFSDNALTVNGIGQKKHSGEARGQIVKEYLHPAFDYVAGDATEAYEGRLKKYIRHVCFVKPNLIFMLDEVEAPEPSLFQMHLHSFNPFTVKAQYEIETGNDIAKALIAFVTPADLRITPSDGLNPASVGYERPQYHLQIENPTPQLRSHFLSMYCPYKPESVPTAKYDFALKGNLQMYYCVVDSQKTLLFVNPKREEYTYGAITTDASLMVMTTYENNFADSILFTSDASIIKKSGDPIFQSEKRDACFLQWKDIGKILKPVEW